METDTETQTARKINTLREGDTDTVEGYFIIKQQVELCT